MEFYRDINFLTIQDNVELIKHLKIQHCPFNLQQPRIRYIKLEELYLDEIYFDPLKIYFLPDKIRIEPFIVIIDGSIININVNEFTLERKDMLYLTNQGIIKNIDNIDINKYVFSNGRIYWLLSKDSENQYSILQC